MRHRTPLTFRSQEVFFVRDSFSIFGLKQDKNVLGDVDLYVSFWAVAASLICSIIATISGMAGP